MPTAKLLLVNISIASTAVSAKTIQEQNEKRVGRLATTTTGWNFVNQG